MEQKNDEDKEPEMPNNYMPSYSTGFYGSYVLLPLNETQDNEPEEEKIDHRQQIQAEIASISAQPQASRTRVFELAKQSFRERGEPVFIDTSDALSEIKENAENYKNVALPLTLARDRPFSEWNEQQFKQDFSQQFDVPIECIRIISVRAGSQIIDLKLETRSDGGDLILPIEVLADKVNGITNEKAKKALVEFGIFAVEFGKPTAGFNCLQQRVILNPQWNREYGPGHTNWDGPLNDDKSRGGEPYFCPKGWKRFAIQFKETAYDFANIYDKWPIAYHGTKFEFSMMITLSGLMCSGGCHGDAVYLSPSIKYVSHPIYAKCVKMNLSKIKQMDKEKKITQAQINEFSKYDGKWVQCAFMCRVKPGAYRKCRQTMGLGDSGKFDGIEKSTIEWVVPGSCGTIIGNDKILIYGIMIRARDTPQTGYHDY